MPAAAGVTVEIDAIIPLLSGGGGAAALNIEWVRGDGFGLYPVIPTVKPSDGFSVGASIQGNLAWRPNGGTTPWSGDFDQVSGNLGPMSGSAFSSPDDKWGGVSLGVGVGPPLGLARTQTNSVEIGSSGNSGDGGVAPEPPPPPPPPMSGLDGGMSIPPPPPSP